MKENIKKNEVSSLDFASNKDLSFIYKSYFKTLFNYGMQLIKDRDLVKDSIQDVFIDFTINKDSRNILNIKLYLFSSLKYRIYNRNKKEQRIQKVNDEYYCNNLIELEDSFQDKLILSQEEELRKKHLSKAYSYLTPRQREAIFLRYYENFSYEEIASILSLEDVKSARNLVYKGIVTLRSNFFAKRSKASKTSGTDFITCLISVILIAP